ncbi:MAG: efflux RND transporter periplasmic adaptor subunit [Phycisphaerae bacterium]
MGKRLVTAISGTATVVVVATIVILNMMASDPGGRATAAEDGKTPTAAESRPVSVEVTAPQRRAVTRNLRMPATLLAGEQADLYAKTSGYISEVKVDIGDAVRKDDPLVSLDVPEMADGLRRAEAVREAERARAIQSKTLLDIARAEVQRADAAHELSHVSFGRTEELRRANAIPEQDLDEARSKLAIADAGRKIARAKVIRGEADVKVAESQVATADATVARLKTLMRYATIRAPFDGVITERMVDPGAFVRSATEGAATALLSVSRIDFIRLALEIPESDAPYVHPDTEVDIEIKALGGPPMHATVTRTARALKPRTRTMRAEVHLDNDDGRLVPGMYAQVVVKLQTTAEALVVPSRAIHVRGRATSVLVAVGDVAQSIPIKLGYDDGIWAEVTEGLNGGEQVIVSSNSVVAPGAVVKSTPFREIKPS